MNLALRDIRHKLGRFLLTCAGLGLLLGVALAMVGIYRGVVDEALSLTRALGADLWVVEGGTRGPFAEASRIPGDTREAVARIAGVVAAGSVTFQTVEARAAGTAAASTAGAFRNEAGRERVGAALRVQILGYELDRPGGPPPLAEGRGIAARREMVLDRGAGQPLGAMVEIGGLRFRVVGLTARAVSSGGDPLGWITLADAQELQFRLNAPAARRATASGSAGQPRDTVNAVIARLAPHADPVLITEQLRHWKHLAALTSAEQDNILTRSVVERARKQLGLFTTILLLVSGVIVALIVYMLTMDKLREIATLKLIGAPDRAIVSLVMQQALLLGAVSFASGATLLLLVKDVFPRRVVLGPEELAGVGLVVFVICLLASLLGVRAALRIEPAQALGG
ncbi:ABC transporter permease [Sediminicoccus rosea]|jgi:putative ABC transport system permease protein|uniref:ABC transporter permease n=1 Tax=Sediminicoccus rosea TaxID=1225128 RepID=A0ABZ0PPE0_9PROT|nr:ABC transporter permease [Sediminicoccus rosea]WPB87326.1 ABC transporter permease [Sediminicoccus rosea]